MRTQAESTGIAHNMFGQIKMKIPWYNCRHTLISRKRDGKPRMIGGQFVVVRVGVNSHPMLQICRNKLLHGNSTPRLNSSYIQPTPTQSLKSAQHLSSSRRPGQKPFPESFVVKIAVAMALGIHACHRALAAC